MLVHGQLLGVDQLDAVRRTGVLISFFAAHVYHWGDIHIRNFGMGRARYLTPARSALERGIPITFHQDTPVLPPDMLETIWCAAVRRTREGVQMEERIGVQEGLQAVTANTAYQYFEEDSKGTIAPGKRADFVVLERNPLEVPLEELREICPAFDEDIYDAISMDTCVNKRLTIGAPGKEAMEKVIAIYRNDLSESDEI